MFKSTLVITSIALLAGRSLSAPIHKRIAQTIPDATRPWEQACIAAGGGERCNPISVQAIDTLLAAPPACNQQDVADTMIDLAKELGSDEMIRLAQIFRQQPRNSPESTSSLYCQTPPRNPELVGLFQCQFAGTDPQTFTGGAALGAPDTIPLGLNGPVTPPGSCPAHPDSAVPDGAQLNVIVNDPGQGNGGAGNGGNVAPPPGTTSAALPTDPAETGAAVTVTETISVTVTVTEGGEPVAAPTSSEVAIPDPPAAIADPPAVSGTEPAAPPQETAPAGAKPFTLQNGKDAQKLNADFATLTIDDVCNANQIGCIDGGFSQCVDGRWVVVGCAGGSQCFALPLVNAPGTSVTCANPQDAAQRIAATGALGGITGSE